MTATPDSSIKTADVLAADRVLMGADGPADPVAAHQMYEAAVKQGSGAAAERLAVLAAVGVARDADWKEALDHLARAAELGHRPAQRQLAILGDREDLSGRTLKPAMWAKVREGIDPGALLNFGRIKREFSSPDIFVVEGVASRAMCKWIVLRGRGRLARGEVRHVESGQSQADPMRTAEAAPFRLTDADLVTALVQERVARASRLPVHTHEPPNLLHYAPGQEYQPHFDFIDPQVPGFRDQLTVLGQRIATCLVYLNDDYAGGETAFLQLGWKYRGRPGDALLFFNVDARGQPHPQSLHAGLPPTRGEKWLWSIWVRDRVQPIL
jgi:predicted 2-oxoglutarate/Fe(II)-dependent dioxygenase YbiX